MRGTSGARSTSGQTCEGVDWVLIVQHRRRGMTTLKLKTFPMINGGQYIHALAMCSQTLMNDVCRCGVAWRVEAHAIARLHGTQHVL